MIALYNALFYRPLLNILIFFYQTIAFRDLGLAIIFLTVLIRVVLYPLFQKSIRNQMMMEHIQPEVKKIQERHRDSYEKQGKAMMELYREYKVNPLSNFLFLLIQLPILIALFRIILNAPTPEILSGAYGFIQSPDTLNPYFLGLINLTKTNILIVVLATAATYIQGQTSLARTREAGKGKEPTSAQKVSRNLVYIMPAVTFLVLFRLPAAIGLYWLVTSLFSIFQQHNINKKLRNGKLGNIRHQPT